MTKTSQTVVFFGSGPVAARSLEHVLLFLPRFLEHVGAHLLAHAAGVGDELLRLAARGVDRRLMLAQQLRGRFAIAPGALDRLLERLLARFDLFACDHSWLSDRTEPGRTTYALGVSTSASTTT